MQLLAAALPAAYLPRGRKATTVGGPSNVPRA